MRGTSFKAVLNILTDVCAEMSRTVGGSKKALTTPPWPIQMLFDISAGPEAGYKGFIQTYILYFEDGTCVAVAGVTCLCEFFLRHHGTRSQLFQGP
eukprot:m.320898 g.320898  ORF g.320898 m.320898 type:complete len:96 (-) comp16454_c0_seq31:4073-4360(-)